MVDLGTLGGSYISSHAIDINSSGQVVGYCSLSNDDPNLKNIISGASTFTNRLFLYSNGTMVAIDDLVGVVPGTFQAVQSIDDSGRIVVTGSQMIDWGLYRDYSCILTPVPEPSIAILLAFGLLGFAYFHSAKFFRIFSPSA
jgi:hypothetical protein